MLVASPRPQSARRSTTLHTRALPALIPLAAALAALLSAAPAQACNIPVFRFALERWRPDPFTVVVFHDQPLDDSQIRCLEAWRQRSSDSASSTADANSNPLVANFDLEVVDRSQPESAQAWSELWQAVLRDRPAPPTLPLVVIQAPGDPRKPLVVAAGPLVDSTVSAAVDSPLRRELLQRLLAGHSVVWLWIPGADEEANRRLSRLLDERLPALEQEIELPDGIGTDGFDLLTDIPLEIKFSALRLPRDAPAEQAFLKLLAAHFPALDEQPDSPFLLPVFGAARLLDAIPGADVDPDVLRDAADFLCGACSCQVKNLNPGVDLLLTADWDALLAQAGDPAASRPVDPPLATAPARSPAPSPEPVYVPIPGKNRSTPHDSPPPSAAPSATVTPAARPAPSLTPSDSPPAAVSADPPVAATYGSSRSDKDQAEPWPLAINLLMLTAGVASATTFVVRTVRRRRRLAQLEP